MSIFMCGGCTADHCNSGGACITSVESWAGCVLSKHERNGYDDSDFYALVWDASDQKVKTIEYASTRGWTYHNHAQVDASTEVIALAAAWTRARNAEIDAEIAALDALRTSVGKEVVSLTTRGKNKGVRGLVRRIESSRFGPGRVAVIEVAGESSFRYIDLDRVRVIQPASV